MDASEVHLRCKTCGNLAANRKKHHEMTGFANWRKAKIHRKSLPHILPTPLRKPLHQKHLFRPGFPPDFPLTLAFPAPSMQPESSNGFASVGAILPKEGAALLPGGSFRFSRQLPSPPLPPRLIPPPDRSTCARRPRTPNCSLGTRRPAAGLRRRISGRRAAHTPPAPRARIRQ